MIYFHTSTSHCDVTFHANITSVMNSCEHWKQRSKIKNYHEHFLMWQSQPKPLVKVVKVYLLSFSFTI